MAEYEVADPFAAFATAFLNQSAQYIKERKDDANEAKERMYELAQRNKGKVDQYMLAVNNVGNVAEKLHKNYNIPQAAIVALNRTGPTALTDAYTQLEKMAATHSREFVSKYADMIIEGYNPDEYDTGTPFRQQIESQFTEGLSVGDYEADERSWWDKAIGRGAKDSMREALDREILSSGMSVYDMANFSEAKIDDAYSIDDHEALPILYDLIQNEGLSLGTSCGINIAGAIRMGKELGPGKTIVTILCDRSDKYATKMFNKKFLEEKGLPIPNWF